MSNIQNFPEPVDKKIACTYGSGIGCERNLKSRSFDQEEMDQGVISLSPGTDKG